MTFKGKWRIVEMEMSDANFLNMMEPAYILFDGKTGAKFAFGCATGPLRRYGDNSTPIARRRETSSTAC